MPALLPPDLLLLQFEKEPKSFETIGAALILGLHKIR
jgi:hypothetical protein